MNYELLSKIAMKESDALKKEVAILQKRDELLNLEITNLKSMIEIIEKEKTELREERNHLKNEKNTLGTYCSNEKSNKPLKYLSDQDHFSIAIQEMKGFCIVQIIFFKILLVN